MPVLPIVDFDHPDFRALCAPVSADELKDPKFQKFLDDFAETCAASGAVGLGAPQVGVHKRVIVVSVDSDDSRYPSQPPFPLTWVINPVIIARSDETELGLEGSVSSDQQGQVPRSKWVTVIGLDRTGADVRHVVSDPFHARVFQHEIDYLDGRLFTDLC